MDKIKTGVSYFGNRNPRHFVSDLEEILDHNCNFIVHTFSENDFEYYRETIKELVSLSKEAGLECYLDPWGMGRVFGGEAYSGFALRNRDANQILPDGEWAPAACLNHPRFRSFMRAWIDAAAETDADVLFWDEPHFYVDLKEKDKYPLWYCSCKTCSQRFEDIHHKPFDEVSLSEITQFRDECVVEFLKELCDLAHTKNLKNAVCLLPFKDERIGISDWSRIAAIPSVDIFGTDPYWQFF
ncbi:EAL domain-containing protein, partial [candidate division KSB1 bacterium]|nr:EAL domain-containing protein [candidate division KSB1 bacterium]NIR72482.1 EAL domain-containing protein [candidate division KSB1 bacterium]NIS24067.1 EAL domain-containing protein [candidate division KSB1 bacterium]NIT70986.1 EAL domain-containing protein [candidate division KSB1 bacterium]NIU27397.1 EAL domain-containing protein [candidate division KSB1 bacterium]